MAQNETARATIYLDGKQAEAAIDALKAKSKELKVQLEAAKKAGDSITMKKLETEIRSVDTASRSLLKDSFDVERVLQNINKVSWRDLEKAQKAVVSDMKRMERGTADYAAKEKNLAKITAELNRTRGVMRQSEGFWSNMANGANKYFNVIAGGIAALAGFVFSFRQVIQTFNDFEQRLDNLSALTGQSGENLEWLGKKAKELSTSMLDGGIRITKSAGDIVDAFTKMGSARPELLKNKEDLVQVTEKALILAQASQMEMQPAIEAVAAAMNQFNLGASESSRIINAMGAGSLAGSSEVGDLTQSLSTCGTVAANSNLSLEQTVAVLETLAERQLKGEEAGTQFKTSLIAMKAAGLGYVSGVFNMRDAIVELKSKIDAKNTAQEKDNELISVFGKRNITVGTILTTAIDRYDYFAKAVTGTNVAFEQAAVNSQSNAARLAQASNRLNVMSIELGEKLAPALTVSTSGLAYFVKGMAALVDVWIKYYPIIIGATAAITGYTFANKIAAAWTITITALEKAGAVAKALLTGQIKIATIAQRAWNLAVASNPLGAIIAVVLAVSAAIWQYSKNLNEVSAAQKAVNEVNIEAQKAMVEEKVKVEQLLKVAKNEKLSKETRLKAIKDLNEISPEYLGNLTLEKINTDESKKATDNYIESIKKKAKAQAGFQKLVDIEKELIDLQNGEGADSSFWQDSWNMATSFGNAAVYAGKATATAIENMNEKTKALLETKKKLTEQMDAENKTPDVKGSGLHTEDIKQAQDLIYLKEEELKLANKMPGSTKKELADRQRKVEAIEKEIAKLKELGTTKQGSIDDKAESEAEKKEKKRLKKLLDYITAEHEAKMANIKLDHLETKGSEDQFDADLLAEDLNFQTAKMLIYEKGSKEYEQAYSESLQLQVDAEKTVHELLLKAQKELANAKIENLKDGIAKEKAQEEQRWSEELDGLWKQLNSKKDLNAEEEALNDTINKTIEEKQAAHLKKMADLDKAIVLQKQMDKALTDTAKAKTDKEKFAAEREVAQANYQQALTDAKGNARAIAQAERALSDELVRIKRDEQQRKHDIELAIVDSAYNMFGALVELVGKQTALGKALFAFQQAAAVGQIIINTAVANSKALAEFPGPVGIALTVMNTIAAAAGIASVLAQTFKSFSAPDSGSKDSSSDKTGKQSGGYSGSGADNEVDGFYHKNEFIASAPAVRNPTVKPILDIIDMAQRSGTIRSLNLSALVSAGRQAGGYSPHQHSDNYRSPAVGGLKSAGLMDVGEVMNRVAAALENNERQMARVEKWNPSISIETYERKRKNWEKTTTGGLK